MKLLYLSTILFLFSVCGYSQTNLVPNPSFEDTSYCITGSGQIVAANGWIPFIDTPDYFHPCTNNSQVSVPNNWGGYQQPATGNAYCAVGTYQDYFNQTNLREAIGIGMYQTLVIGVKYFVSFKANLSLSNSIWANCATNNLGVSFSTMQYHRTTNPAPINNNSKVYASNILLDTAGWTTISGSFIADSAYNYVMVGNFFDDMNTQKLVISGDTNCFAYYFIDDICVSTDSLLCTPPINIIEIKQKQNFLIYPNPFTNIITIDNNSINKSFDLIIYNSLGQVLYEEHNLYERKTLDLSFIKNDFILITINSNEKELHYKLIKN